MGSVIGSILPLALGIALSPLPVIAVILLLLADKARAKSVAFLLGWLLGAFGILAIFTVVSAVVTLPSSSGRGALQGWIHLGLGILLLFLAYRNFRKPRPEPGHAELPKWMQALDRLSALDTFGLGILLSGVNPKNLLLGVSAGVVVGSSSLRVADSVVVAIVYTVVASATILVPVVAYLFAADALRGKLMALRGWLERENSVIMAVVLLVLGFVVLGKGIASF